MIHDKLIFIMFTYLGEEYEFTAPVFDRPNIGEEITLSFEFNLPKNRKQPENMPNFVRLKVTEIFSSLRLFDSGSTEWQTCCQCEVAQPTTEEGD